MPVLAGVTNALDVYTTLDIQLQRLAQDVMRDGLVRVDESSPAASASDRRKRR